jgi:hypothetical protein
MPQLDSCVFFESTFLTLLLFWESTYLFVYIIAPLIKLRSDLTSSDLYSYEKVPKGKNADFISIKLDKKKYVKSLQRFNDTFA